MSDWKTIALIISIALTAPFAIYMLGNTYVYLFDGWHLNADKMMAAFWGVGLGALIIFAIATYPGGRE